MGDKKLRGADCGKRLWRLAAVQHWVVTRHQLLELGFTSRAIEHAIRTGRLHPVWRGVYLVGRPQLTRHARWMAAALSCGPRAILSDSSAAALWEIGDELPGLVEVTVPPQVLRRRPGISVHRRRTLAPPDITRRAGIPVTTPARTLIDLAPLLTRSRLERAINDADKRGLIDLERVRSRLGPAPGRPEIAVLRSVLDRRTFRFTDSELERWLLSLVRRAGLPMPLTQRVVNGVRVDFLWPDLGLVVETDGLTYHRTPAQQARDRLRDQAHFAAGLTCLRFTHAQLRFDPDGSLRTLAKVIHRLGADRR
jgi:very-short-patch-repair endonuclease